MTEQTVVLGTQAQLDPTVTTPVEIRETDEPSYHGIDGVERMCLIRDDIANRVRALIAGHVCLRAASA